MNTTALDDCLAQHRAHAARTQRLDEHLGNWHGITWSDFVLLDALDTQGAQPVAALAARLAVPRSRLLAQVLPLEKLGWVQREGETAAARQVALSDSGRRLVNGARESAADLCQRLAPKPQANCARP
jgi:DNA-binding MarR family transcriptional regulator